MDLVYFIKDSAYNNELKYSLRSVEQNLPNSTVWFVGGKPVGLRPDHQITLRQTGPSKWANVAHTLHEFIERPDAPEEFVLMNDDFFVMWPVDDLKVAFCGTLQGLQDRVASRNKNRPTQYTERLRQAQEALEAQGLTTYNFELHRPMPIKKEWLSLVYERFGEETPAKRSLYGNLFLAALPLVEAPDVKVARSTDPVPINASFVSTEDTSFERGPTAKFIREAFPQRSRFER